MSHTDQSRCAHILISLDQLVQTGKFFKEAASNGPGDLVSARDLLKEVGTSANRRFHEALDELEIECVRRTHMQIPIRQSYHQRVACHRL